MGLSAAAAAVALPFTVLATIAFASLAAFLAIVFRDPPRRIGEGIVSPADGRVREVDASKGFISIYLALRNVHVTRAPLSGTVLRTARVRGKHMPAFSRATTGNERVEISLGTDIGEVSIVEMTGVIARRIVPYIAPGQALGKGTKLSLIRFGSRVDLSLPPSKVHILVEKGQRLYAGKTSIAEVRDGPME